MRDIRVSVCIDIPTSLEQPPPGTPPPLLKRVIWKFCAPEICAANPPQDVEHFENSPL